MGAFLALTKPKVNRSEEMIVSLILFFLGGKSSLLINKTKKNTKSKKFSSKKLGYAESLIDDLKENEIKTLTVSDLSRPYRLKIKLVGQSGNVLANKKSKIYLDGIYLDALTSDINGELETIIIPKTAGLKKILVNVDEQIEPIFSETIEVKTPQENPA